MKWSAKLLIMAWIPILLSTLLKYGVQRYVRMEVVGPGVSPLPAEELVELIQDRTILCVGCTAGIGEGVAMGACTRGAKVIVVGRRSPSSLLEACPSLVRHLPVDLSLLSSARAVARSLQGEDIDTVVFTVGITAGPSREETAEGLESDTAISFMSRFAMSRQLVVSDALHSSNGRKPRVFIMGFPGTSDIPQLDDFNWDRVPWQPWAAHKNGVIANDALVIGLARRHPEVNVYGLNPGIIKTDILAPFLGGKDSLVAKVQQAVVGVVCPSVEEYVEGTLLHLLVAPELEGRSGTFFNQKGEQIYPSTWLLENGENGERIWEEAEALERRVLINTSRSE